MEKKFIKITNKNEWQDSLKKVLFKTFFHKIEWEEFLEENFKWLKFERYLWREEALLSLAKVGDKLISHPFCEYGGFLPLKQEININELKKDLFSELGDSYEIKISFHPYLLNYFFPHLQAKNLPAGEFFDWQRVTYFIEGLPNLRKTTRREIRKAQVQNIRVERCQNLKDLENFYHLHLRLAKKHKIPAYPFSFFHYLWRSREAEIILAKFKNKIIAGSIFLFYDKFIHYFQNASDQQYKNSGANYLILWREIQNYPHLTFDLGGTRKGSSLEVFKKGWRGKEYPIFELKNYSSSSELRESKLRTIFGFLPLFLIKKISPYLLKHKL